MLFIQSILVYGFIIWVMTYFGNIAYKSQYPLGIDGVNRYANKKVPFFTLFTKSYFLIPIFVFCLFAAVRYRVGVDCESYKESFYEIAVFGESIRTQEIEPLFVFLSKLSLSFSSKHYILFFLLALCQVCLYYSCFIKDTYVLVFLSIALILTGEYWSWMNGMRQNIAACAFVATIPLILRKKWLLFIISAFIASLMHRSALVILPIGIAIFFFRKNILNKYVQLGIIAICFLCMNKLNNYIDTYISLLGMQLGYNDAKIDGYSELEATTVTFGLRSYLLYGTYIMAVLFSDKMKQFYKSEKFNICYNLFFIAVSMSLLFYNCFAVNRMLYYITIFIPAVISYLLFYLHNNRKRYLLFFAITLFILLTRTLLNFYLEMDNPINETILYKFDI